MGNRLNDATRESDVVARLGGDEFIIITEHPNDNDDKPCLIERIQQCQDDRVSIDGEEIKVSFSIGIASFPTDGDDFQSLLVAADTAMYEAKRKKTGYACYYQEQLGAKVAEHYRLSAIVETSNCYFK